MDDRPPPLDHPALDLGRAGRRRVHHRAQRRDVVRGADVVGQLEHAHEHGRDELGVRHPVLLHQRQAALRVEVLHHHHGPAQALRGHRPHQRRGVVEGRRAQVDVAGAEPHDAAEHRGQRHVGAEGQPAQRAADPLGVTGRARGVEHRESPRPRRRAARPGTRRRTRRRRCAPCDGVAHHQAQLDLRRQRDQLRRQRRERRRRDQRAGAAVHDDVRRLLGGEVRVDHGVVQAGALEPEGHLVGPVVVGQQHRHVVPGPQPVGEQGLGQPARALLELGERHDPARRGDHGRPLGVGGGVGGGAEMRRAGVSGLTVPLLAQTSRTVAPYGSAPLG